MPTLSAGDTALLYFSGLKAADIATLPRGRAGTPVPAMLLQVTSDRLSLAGEHLRVGDTLLLHSQFRSAISRHYYAMYHSARAVVFGVVQGDDHEKHAVLPRNLPITMADMPLRELQLQDARLLRNQADYDPYPANGTSWEPGSRSLAAISADFVQACEDFALMNGLV